MNVGTRLVPVLEHCDTINTKLEIVKAHIAMVLITELNHHQPVHSVEKRLEVKQKQFQPVISV